jgi:hypothetical protein
MLSCTLALWLNRESCSGLRLQVCSACLSICRLVVWLYEHSQCSTHKPIAHAAACLVISREDETPEDMSTKLELRPPN